MDSSYYIYDGNFWKPSPTVHDTDSFFHAAFGERANETERYLDKHSRVKRLHWAAFLAHFQKEAMPPRLLDTLRKCLSANDKYKHASIEDADLYESYISDVMMAGRGVAVEEIPVLATLEKTKIIVLARDSSDPLVDAKPDFELLGNYSAPHKSQRDTVVLGLDGSTFSRLIPVEGSTLELDKRGIESAKTKSDAVQFSNKGTYKKGGSAGSKGVEYQVGLLVVILLNASRRLRMWRLSTENKEAGKFDDAVLEWPEGEILFQAKHRENKSKRITLEQLISTNSKRDEFSLAKYFLNYQRAKEKFKNILNLIICTNVGVHQEVLPFLNPPASCTDSILFHEEGDCPFYTFNDKILPDLKQHTIIYHRQHFKNKGVEESVIMDENLKDFLSLLRIYFGYLPQDKMGTVIDNLLSTSKNTGKVSAADITAKVKDWFQQRKGEYLNETHATSKFVEIRTEKCFQMLNQFDVSFEHNWEFEGKDRVIQVVAEGGYLLQVLKTYRSLKCVKSKILFIDPDGDTEVLNQGVEAFKLLHYELLVVIWREDVKHNVLKDICNNLIVILGKHEYKKVILVGKDDNKLLQQLGFGYRIIKESVTLENLSTDTQERLLRKQSVIFQGRNISLKELFGNQMSQNEKKSLNSGILEKLIRDEKIKVGLEVGPLDDLLAICYVERSFERAIEVEETSRKRKETVQEEKIFEIEDKVMLIEDLAGAGKTTVLDHLAGTIKRKNPHLWVVVIKLNDYTRILNEFIERNKETITIMELMNSANTTKLSNELETLVFLESKKVVLMLDGVDEISPDYTNLILNMLADQRKSNFAKVFVTTRPHMARRLEEILDVKSFKLQPFTHENQIDFLTSYWSHNLRLDGKNRKRCKQYAEELLTKTLSSLNLDYSKEHFAAVPLQVIMLADVFQENKGLTEWQGCKEFLNSCEETPRLLVKINLAKIYEMFIERKRNVHMLRGNPTRNVSANLALLSRFDECRVYHRKLALEEVLTKSECEFFSDYNKNHKNVEEILKIGIVQKSKNRFYFSHRTVAEYFVAESILKELQYQTQNQEVKFQKFFFDQVLLHAKFKVVRSFLNNFLENIVNSLPSDVFTSYESLSYRINWEANFKLVHQLAEEGCVAILQLLLKCIDFEIVTDRDLDIVDLFKSYPTCKNSLKVLKVLVRQVGVNIKTEENKTPLSHAILSGGMEMVKFLVDHGANISSSELHEATCQNHIDMVIYLLEKVLVSGGSVAKSFIVPYTLSYLGRLTQLKRLVEHGLDVNGRVVFGEQFTFGAARGGQLDTIRYLVQKGVNINSRDEFGNTALHFIADMPSRITTARLLIELGINVNVKNNMCCIALLYAVKDLRMMELLIKSGSNVNNRNLRGESILWEAVWENNLEVIKFLLACGCDLNIRSWYGRTVLHLAAEQGKLDIVEYFLDSRARIDVDITDNDGYTPLHVTASVGRQNAAEYLVKFGADVYKTERNGLTALHLAAFHGHLEIVRFLANHLDVNVRVKRNQTALHLAIMRDDNLDVVRYLVEHSADINAIDNEGRTVLSNALYILRDKGIHKKRSASSVARYLIEQGADAHVRESSGMSPLSLEEKEEILHMCERVDITREGELYNCNVM